MKLKYTLDEHLRDTRDNTIKLLLTQCLDCNRGDIAAVAKALNRSKSWVRNQCQRLDIAATDFVR